MRDFSIDLIWAKIQAAMPARIRGGKTSFRTQNSSHSKSDMNQKNMMKRKPHVNPIFKLAFSHDP